MRGMLRYVLLVFLLQNAVLSGEDDLFDWNQTPDLFPGIKHAFLDTKQPRPLKINVIRVDLTRKDLRFMTVKRDPDWGKPMPDYPSLPIRTRRLTVRKFMQNALDRGIDMLVAVNAAPWSPWKPPYTHSYAAKLGLLISDGEIVDKANGRPVFLITKKGEFQIRKVGKDEDVSDIQFAVPGFAVILENGKAIGGKDLAPRTAYGLSAGNHYMIIMTIDGRMKEISEGVSTKELGGWMRKFGAEKAINMDGGGSTTLVVSDGMGGIKRLNYGFIYRTVSASLGIYRVKKQFNRNNDFFSHTDLIFPMTSFIRKQLNTSVFLRDCMQADYPASDMYVLQQGSYIFQSFPLFFSEFRCILLIKKLSRNESGNIAEKPQKKERR